MKSPVSKYFVTFNVDSHQLHRNTIVQRSMNVPKTNINRISNKVQSLEFSNEFHYKI